MAYERKNIILVLCGDVPLLGRDGVLRHVRNPHEVDAWFESIPELTLVAHVKSMFLPFAASAGNDPELWRSVARLIQKQYLAADGFVLVQRDGAVASTAAALSLMVQKLTKPIVLVGASQSGGKTQGRPRTKPSTSYDLTIRANLVNAIQFATLDIGEVAVLAGNMLYRGSTFFGMGDRNNETVGRIDFGITVSQAKTKQTVVPTLKINLKPRVAFVMLSPADPLLALQGFTAAKLDGVVMGIPHGTLTPMLKTALRNAAKKIPVAIYTSERSVRPDGYFVMRNVTQHMAVVKFMWALGQESQFAAVQKLLETEIAHEFVKKKL